MGCVLIFFGIMRELSASILLYVPGTEVMSVVHAEDVGEAASPRR